MEENEKSLQQQLQEAEQRGYQRGLNEQIESKMQEPAVWESKSTAQEPEPTPKPQEFQILATPHRSIWTN